MKFRTTVKELKTGYKNDRAIGIGYCEADYLLFYQAPTCYTCGVYGWNFDGYEIEEKDILITTGYRGMFGTRPDFNTLQDYNNRACGIIHDRNKTHDEKRDEVNALLFEFIGKTLNRG